MFNLFQVKGGIPPSYSPIATVIVSYDMDLYSGRSKEQINVETRLGVCLTYFKLKGAYPLLIAP